MDSWLDEWMTLTKILVPICIYCLKWTKFGQLILTKIINTVATKSQILRLKCTKAYDAPQDALVAFYGFACKGRRKGSGGEGNGREITARS